MARIARNQSCPCRSGQKYKKCCWPLHEAAGAPARFGSGERELDTLSNGVLDLIEERRWEAAEAACKELCQRYPSQVDGLERTGLLRQAQGRFDEAADCYRKAAVFASVRPGFEPDSVAYFWEQAEEMETQARQGLV